MKQDWWVLLKARGAPKRREELRRIADTFYDDEEPSYSGKRLAALARHSDELAQTISEQTGKPPDKYKDKVQVVAREGYDTTPQFKDNVARVTYQRERRPSPRNKNDNPWSDDGIKDIRFLGDARNPYSKYGELSQIIPKEPEYNLEDDEAFLENMRRMGLD